MTAWDTALAFVWRPENDGQEVGDAPGEAFRTRWGVTAMTWNGAVDEGVVPNVTLQNATKDQLATILRIDYWNRVQADRLVAGGNAGAALMVFNMAMQAGVGRAARLLQRVVGVDQDGQIGPQTVAAALHMDPSKLVLALAQADQVFFSQCAQAGRFLHGWTRRVEDAKKVALGLLQAA